MAQYEITTEPVPLDFEVTMANDIVERTIRNAKNLMMTIKGEIPYDRQRGLDPMIFDLPLPQAQELITPEMDRVMLWEPDAEVVQAWITKDAEGNSIVHCIIDVTFED